MAGLADAHGDWLVALGLDKGITLKGNQNWACRAVREQSSVTNVLRSVRARCRGSVFSSEPAAVRSICAAQYKPLINGRLRRNALGLRGWQQIDTLRPRRTATINRAHGGKFRILQGCSAVDLAHVGLLRPGTLVTPGFPSVLARSTRGDRDGRESPVTSSGYHVVLHHSSAHPVMFPFYTREHMI